MKNLIYILFGFIAISFIACDKDSNYNGSAGIKTKPANDTTTPQDTTPKTPEHKWETVVGKSLPIVEMIATPWIKFNCTDGKVDSVQMEPWLLDITTIDLVVYRDSYQSTSKSGITPDAERSSSDPYIDKFGNTVQRHSYTQRFKFNNFTHSMSGAWNTGYLSYNGKQESFWPEGGLSYELTSITGNTINDTVHFVRNDSIFAKETVKLTYTATLHVEAGKLSSRYMWERSATILVISFVGLVQHEDPIPTANDYIANLEWHADKANRFENGAGQWCDGILFSSKTHWYMLVTTFKLSGDGTKEEILEIKLDSIAKSEMATPDAGREYNAVMWGTKVGKPVPCHLEVNGDGWGLGTKYANGKGDTKQHSRNEAVMSGVKNLSEENNSTPTPWISTDWSGNTKYKGKNFYSVSWHTNGKNGKPVHSCSRTIADSSLK